MIATARRRPSASRTTGIWANTTVAALATRSSPINRGPRLSTPLAPPTTLSNRPRVENQSMTIWGPMILDDDAVRARLRAPEAVTVMREALIAFHRGQLEAPPRTR